MEAHIFADIVDTALAGRFFAEEGPLKARHLAEPDAPLTLVVGDNGSGKSFLVKVLSAIAKNQGMTSMTLSMAKRSESGSQIRVMMFGDEAQQSTGLTSVQAVETGLNSMRSWNKDHIACFDEPDLGLSDYFAYPMGQLIAQFALAPAERTRGVFVVTHNRELIQGIQDELAAQGHKPSVVFVGSRYQSLEQFMERGHRGSVAEMLDLAGSSIDLWRALQRAINNGKQ